MVMSSEFNLIGADAIKSNLKDQIACNLFDAHSGGHISEDAFEKARVQANTRVFNELLEIAGKDAIGNADGQAFARQLEHVITKILETPYEPTKLLSLYGTDRSIPANKTTWTQRRRKRQGSWRFMSAGNSSLPTHNVTFDEKSGRIVFAGTAIRLNVFELMTMSGIGLNLESEMRKSATESSEEFIDSVGWVSPLPGVLDILNAPYINVMSASVPFTSASSTDAIKAQLDAAANFIAEASNEVYGQGLRMQVSPAMRNYLSQRYRNAFNSEDVLQGFMSKNAYVTEIVTNHKLAGAGPNGRDLIIFEKAANKKVVIPKGVTWLPVQREGFDLVFLAYMAYGGIKDDNPVETLIMDVELA